MKRRQLFFLGGIILVCAGSVFARSGVPRQRTRMKVNAEINKWCEVVSIPSYTPMKLNFTGSANETMGEHTLVKVEANGDTFVDILVSDLDNPIGLQIPNTLISVIRNGSGTLGVGRIKVPYNRVNDGRLSLDIYTEFTTGKISKQAAGDDYSGTIQVTIEDWS